MTRKILLTGPALAHDAMSYANDLDIQIFPSTPTCRLKSSPRSSATYSPTRSSSGKASSREK